MASALEQFVNNVCTLSAQGKNISFNNLTFHCYWTIDDINFLILGNYRELVETINQSTEVLIKGGPHLDNVLETLDLQQHSLGYLAVLCTKFALPPTNAQNDNRLKQAEDFIIGCIGEQVRFAPETC